MAGLSVEFWRIVYDDQNKVRRGLIAIQERSQPAVSFHHVGFGDGLILHFLLQMLSRPWWSPVAEGAPTPISYGTGNFNSYVEFCQ